MRIKIIEQNTTSNTSIIPTLVNIGTTVYSFYNIYKKFVKGTDYKKLFKSTRLRKGSLVQKTVIDPFGRNEVQKGKIIMKGNIPYVLITQGKNKGTLERWTPDWVVDNGGNNER